MPSIERCSRATVGEKINRGWYTGMYGCISSLRQVTHEGKPRATGLLPQRTPASQVIDNTCYRGGAETNNRSTQTPRTEIEFLNRRTIGFYHVEERSGWHIRLVARLMGKGSPSHLCVYLSATMASLRCPSSCEACRRIRRGIALPRTIGNRFRQPDTADGGLTPPAARRRMTCATAAVVARTPSPIFA